MTTTAKCPHCKTQLALELKLDKVKAGDLPMIIVSCPYCRAVLNAQVDPTVIVNEGVGELGPLTHPAL